MEQGLDWEVVVLIATAIVAILEVIFRILPTSKNISILDFLYKIATFIIPNKHKNKKTGEKGIFKIAKKIKDKLQ